MFFGKRTGGNRRKGVPPSLRRQLMFQGVILVMVVGLLLVIWKRARDQDAARLPAPPLADPVGEDADDDDGSEDGLPPDSLVELAEPEEPKPFVENDDVLAHAWVLEKKGEVDIDAILYFFQKIRTQGDAFPTEEPALSTRRGDDVWKELIQKPNAHRGALVEIAGSLISQIPGHEPLTLDMGVQPDFPNDAGVPTIYRANLYQDQKLFLVYTWKQDSTYAHRDGVVFRGYFCQKYTYEVYLHDEPQKVSVPLLVGQDFELIPSAFTDTMKVESWTTMFAVVLGIAAVGAVVILLSSRRARHSYEARRAEARDQVQGPRPPKIASPDAPPGTGGPDDAPAEPSSPDAASPDAPPLPPDPPS